VPPEGGTPGRTVGKPDILSYPSGPFETVDSFWSVTLVSSFRPPRFNDYQRDRGSKLSLGLLAIPEIPEFLKFQELPAKPKKGKP